MEIKKNIPNNTITRKLVDLDSETGNIYESVNIIARRANQIATELKTELNRQLAAQHQLFKQRVLPDVRGHHLADLA